MDEPDSEEPCGPDGEDDEGWEETSPEDIFTAFMRTPLFEDLYLRMQAQNIAVVDGHLRDLEQAVLREYFRTDRMPMPLLGLVSALSQMWVFAAYELLRTWRQWVKSLLSFSQELKGLSDIARSAALERALREANRRIVDRDDISQYAESFRRVERDSEWAAVLEEAYAAVEPIFRRFEVLRVTLAKHEVPKTKGVRALAPGYARVDMLTGGLYWLIDLKDGFSDLVRRHDLAEELAAMSGVIGTDDPPECPSGS